MEAIELYCGDCLAVLPTLAAGTVDAVIADPPYGTTACAWDSVIPLAPMWAELRRVTKPEAPIVLFAAQPFTAALVMSNPREFRYEWVWDKKAITGHLDAKRRPLRRHEAIAVFSQRGSHTYRPEMRPGKLTIRHREGPGSGVYNASQRTPSASDQRYPTSILEFTNADRAGKVHPTQKPLDLLAYLVRTYSQPGTLVLDFCMGSGTTGAACVQEGRRFIGIERDAAYFALASERIGKVQPALFTEAAK